MIKKQGQNKTVLFSSHILQEVEAMCDRVIIINKGQLVADDKLSNLQKGSEGNHTVVVAFKESVDKRLLEKLNGVSKVEQLQNNQYKLQTAIPEAVRKQLMEIALQQNLNIVSLQSENQSLETIFKTLTN